MNKVYDILNALKDHFEANGLTNKVTFGSVDKVDSDKTNMMSTVNVDISYISVQEHVFRFTIEVYCLGWVKELKTVDPDNDFYGASNIIDVLNEQFTVMAKFIRYISDGSGYDDYMRLSNIPVINKVSDFTGDGLAGWTSNIEIELKNDISAC